ncbi:MAG: hypothetical protein V2B19_14525 [Pseudomonadota bacterium]
MLVIREEQIEALAAAVAGGFETELVKHIKNFAPRHSAVVGAEGIRETVRRGMERARTYGFTNRGPSRFFVELMVMFGSQFDTDPLLPWAEGVLNNESIKNQMERADILHEAMREYMDEVFGSEKKNFFDAMRRLSRTRLEDYPSPGGNFESAIKAGLNTIYPQKCNYLGEEALNDLIGRGKESALSYSISSVHGAALLIVLMFVLGHGVTRDPLYPWISQTLEDESVADPDEKVKRLQAKMKTYLDRTLKNLGQEKVYGAI